MKKINFSLKNFFSYIIMIFLLSFCWNFLTGDNAYQAVKSAFGVFSIALLVISIAEIAFWYQTK